jgi:DtxR family Mn-dependent transcriptional regulator
MELSQTEENYLKAIYKISEREGKAASTNAISNEISISAASVTDMLKRLAEKKMVNYKKHKGVTLTSKGEKIATMLIRKHRLWEVFLVEKLHFSWDEVHEIAEQLEHIKSPNLVKRLDDFLDHPKFDPHGDPIPDADGNFAFRKQVPLAEVLTGKKCVLVGVQDHSTQFLQYLDKLSLGLGTTLEILEIFEYDKSIKIQLKNQQEQILSHKVSENLLVTIS